MKVKCINADGSKLLKVGQIYEVAELNKNHYIMLETPRYGEAYGKERFEEVGRNENSKMH
jgi:hypothetical protein